MTRAHLVEECGEAIAAALDEVEGVELLYLSPAEKAAARPTAPAPPRPLGPA